MCAAQEGRARLAARLRTPAQVKPLLGKEKTRVIFKADQNS